jgi:NAD(P)-dependent dehydrogenase (short-subunit alcohol dehydrogenase family)
VEAEVQAAVADAVERWGTLDALIAAAGSCGQQQPPELDRHLGPVIDVNLKARSSRPSMRAQR